MTRKQHKVIPQDMIKKAEKTSILDYAYANGLELIKDGNNQYCLAGNNSLKINPRDNLYNDFGLPTGTQNKGGNVINFARLNFGYDFAEAVESVLEVKTAGEFKYTKAQKKNNGEFNYPRGLIKVGATKSTKDYLVGERKISEKIVNEFIDKSLIEETRNKEILFNWTDNRNKIINPIYGGTIQGTEKLKNPTNPKRPYTKRILPNSESGMGFNFSVGKPDSIVFCESPIDLMSFYEISSMHNSYQNTHYQSLEGLKGEIVLQTVKDFEKAYGQKPKEITFAIDNDSVAVDFFDSIKKNKNNLYDILKEYDLKAHIPDKQIGKDWNDSLKALKLSNENMTIKQGKGINRR